MTRQLPSLYFSFCLAVFLGCCVLLPAPQARADDLPIRKAGLWEMKIVKTGSGLPDMTMQHCTDESTDKDMSNTVSPMAKQVCSKQDIQKTAGGYVSDSVCTVAGVAMIGLGAGLGGSKGLIGAVLGVALVAAFFGISIIVVGRAARVSPQVMMVTALGTYLLKIVVLLFLVGQFQDSTAFNPRIFGLTAIVCILAYSAAQVIWSMRRKVLYVHPDGER